MLRIAEVVSRELKWSQPSMGRREFGLTASGEPVGRLGFRSLLGSFSTAEGADGSWTFKRVGFWSQKATARELGAEQDLAVFHNNTWRNGGTLELANGTQFRATTNIWQTNFGFESVTEQPLVRFHLSGVLHLSGKVEVAPAATTIGELPLLVYFGWYLAVMLHMDASLSAATAAG